MRLIEFLLDNIFLVVIIFGALASFFGKSGSKQRPGNIPRASRDDQPSMEMPPPMSIPDYREASYEAERLDTQTVYQANTERKPESVNRGSYVDDAEDFAALAKQKAALERALGSAANRAAHAKNSANALQVTQSGTAASSLKSEDIKKAVVWAEILGPPRAKKPYGR